MPRGMQKVRQLVTGGGKDRGQGIIQGAFMVLVLVIVVALVALVGGEYLNAVDTGNGTFSSEISDLEGHTGTAITILGIILIVIPAVAVVGYLRDNLGDMMGGGNGGFGGFR